MSQITIAPPVSIPRTSVENLTATITATEDLTAAPIEVALERTNTDSAAVVWEAADWLSWTELEPGLWLGTLTWLYPGDKDRGVYGFWSNFTSLPEEPKRMHGLVHLY